MKITGTKNKLITWLLSQPEDKVFEIGEYKKKRNLQQNSKYYKLLNELALTLKIGVEELHFQMLKDFAPRYHLTVPKDSDITWIKYIEEVNSIDKNFRHYIIYKPSSELKEDEFAVLLDGLIEECKIQGIETRSPEEILRDDYYLNK